jgi:hypothetical protein
MIFTQRFLYLAQDVGCSGGLLYLSLLILGIKWRWEIHCYLHAAVALFPGKSPLTAHWLGNCINQSPSKGWGNWKRNSIPSCALNCRDWDPNHSLEIVHKKEISSLPGFTLQLSSLWQRAVPAEPSWLFLSHRNGHKTEFTFLGLGSWIVI